MGIHICQPGFHGGKRFLIAVFLRGPCVDVYICALQVKSGTVFEAILEFFHMSHPGIDTIQNSSGDTPVAHPCKPLQSPCSSFVLSIPFCSVGYQRTTVVCTLCFRNRFAIEGAEEVWETQCNTGI